MEKKFTIDKILLWYDGPLMVQGHTDNHFIFALVVDEPRKEDGFSPWIVAEITEYTMKGILTNKIDLRDVFLIHRIETAYTGYFGGGEGEIATIEPIADPIPNHMLPAADCFLFDPLHFVIDTVHDSYPRMVQGHTEDFTILGILQYKMDGDHHWNVMKVRAEYIESALKGDITLKELYDHRMGEIWIGTFDPKVGGIGKAHTWIAEPQEISSENTLKVLQ